MSFFASVAGFQVVSGSLMVPLTGAWTADLVIAGPNAVSGSVAVVIGNLTLQGAVYRSSDFGGSTRCRLVGGAGGWMKDIASQGYGAGVTLAHVLQDAASACGETMGTIAGSAPPAYTRIAGPASDVLWQCVAQGLIPTWHIDASGTTQVSAWPSASVSTPFTVTDQKPDQGLVIIATEDYVSWLPGCTFTAPQLDGSYTNAGVLYNFSDDGQMRFEVLTGTSDRLLGPLASFVASQTAPLRFFGRYGYNVTAATTSTFNGTPIDVSKGLPELQNAPLASDSISSYLPVPGGTAHVMFLDGDATQPICVWTSGPPATVAIGKTPAPVATSAGTLSCIQAIASVITTLGTNLTASPSPPFTTFTTFASSAGPALTALGTTLEPLLLKVPTTTVTAGP